MRLVIPPLDRYVAAVAAITALSLAVRLAVVFQHQVPFGDGGLFYLMMDDIRREGFALPEFASYNGGDIPFAYPPLALYIGALTSEVFGLSGLSVLRFLPLVFGSAAVPAFYILARGLLERKAMALAATCYFATSVIFVWTTMGGGLTRSLGLVLAILAISHLHKLVSDQSAKRIASATGFFSLTLLAHLEMTWIVAVFGSVFLLTSQQNSWRSLLAMLSVGVLALVLTAPWWGLVIARHGFEPYMAVAIEADGWRIWGFLAVLLPLIRRHFLTCLVMSLFLIGGRNIFISLSLGMSIALGWLTVQYAGRGLERLKLLARYSVSRRLALLPGSLVITMLFVLVNAAWFGLTFGAGRSVETPSPEDVSSYAAAREMTSADSRFLVLADEWSSEWFPVFSDRESMATYQGREFQSGTVGFSDTLNRYEALHRCETVACLDSIMDAASQSYSHVYLELSGDNRDLQESLAASSRFELVYDVPGVRIFRNLSESADVEPGQ